MIRRAVVAWLVAGGVASVGSSARADAIADACMSAAERAQALRMQEKLLESRRQLEQCMQAACPAFVRSDCTKWMDEIERALPSLVLRAVDAGQKDVVDARVEIDGVLVADRLDGRPIALDPGSHVVRLSRGTATAEQSILLSEGEHDRLVTLVVDARQPAGAGAPAGHAGIPAPTWVVGGVGLAAIAAGATLWVLGLNERSDLSKSCAPQHDCQPSDVDSSRDKLIAGDVSAGLGLVAMGAAVWFAVTAARPATSPQVGVAVTPWGASIGVSGGY